jgi:hypothetical protein
MKKILNLNYTWIEHFQIPTKTKCPYQPLLPPPFPPPSPERLRWSKWMNLTFTAGIKYWSRSSVETHWLATVNGTGSRPGGLVVGNGNRCFGQGSYLDVRIIHWGSTHGCDHLFKTEFSKEKCVFIQCTYTYTYIYTHTYYTHTYRKNIFTYMIVLRLSGFPCLLWRLRYN